MLVPVSISARPSTLAPKGAARLEPRLPLYLYGRRATRVAVDGPALQVRTAGHAAKRYPLARLSRIVSGPGVEWSAAALAACIRADIPVVFIDQEGSPVGYLQAALRQPSRLDAVLRELLERPDWSTHYAAWLRAERMRVLQDWRRRMSDRGQEVDAREFRELVRAQVYRDAGDGTLAAAQSAFRSALTSYALERIQRAGVQPRYWGHDGQSLAIAADLAGLLCQSLALEFRGMGMAVHGEPAAMLLVSHTFIEAIGHRCAKHLGRLHRRMKELLEEWR